MELYPQSVIKAAGGLVSAIGTNAFPRSMMDEINGILPVSHITVFTFGPSDTVNYLMTEGDIKADRAQELAVAYSEYFFQKDPNLPCIYENRQSTAPQWLSLPRRREGAANFYEYFYTDTDLVDKVALIFSPGDTVFYCNFYRLIDRGRFSAGEKKKLKTLGPLIASCVERHNTVSGGQTKPFAQLSRLTDRERSVCELVVSGYSSEAIALRLDLSINSIKTYRKRAYSKLDISSQNELFHLMLQ